MDLHKKVIPHTYGITLFCVLSGQTAWRKKDSCLSRSLFFILFFSFQFLWQDKLIQFLLYRKDSKSVILSVCAQMLVPGKQASLQSLAKVYDLLNATYKQFLENETVVSIFILCQNRRLVHTFWPVFGL